ncbi:MAG TPA: hypothetical protein VNJ28_06075, partial [Candidatus Limnocylindrales bacterium]|nr:hypothetical protein [Candidatus Limnocylindrales bacterium]
MTTESLAHLPEPSNHPAAPRPLVDGNRFVLVDDRPICAVCGEPVEPVGPDDWRHVPPGRRSGQNVRRWLAPVSLAELRRLRTYEEFAARYPWAARGSPPALGVTTPTLWREAVRRLGEYERTLRRVRRYPLEAGGNPYLDLVALLAAPLRSGPPPGSTSSGRAPLRWAIPGGLAQVLGLPARRRELAALFAWAIPTEEALTTLARLGPLVEGGAGTGYWAALLQARGVDVVAYDLYPPGAEEPNRFHRTARSWTTVQRATSVEAARRHPDRSLFLCWPPVDDEASYRPLRAYAGEVVAYVGDPASGATGSPMFHRELERNWTLVETA